jgi:phage terminase large subunit GpA-like protein
MLKNGIWKPEYPELASTNVTGFHISALYAPIGLGASWKELADSYLKVKDDVNKFRTFVNTKLGETWAERGEAPPYKNIYNRRENYPLNVVPDDVCFLTAGVDVQHNRLELEIVGWCADKRSYSIDYRVLDGNPAETEIWQKLTNVLNERFLRADGLEYPIRMMAIDSGDNTSHVYAYCRQFSTQRVIPIKGQDSLGMAISPPMQNRVNKAGKRIGNIAVWNIGVSFLKVELYANLHLEKDSDGTPPPNYCHFPEYPEHYFRGLTAEEQVTKIIRGYRKTQWVKTYARNEPLDCRIYARAAASVVGLDKMTQKQLKNMVKAPVAKAAPRPVNQVAKQEAVRYIPETPKQETRKVRSIWNR